MNLKVAHLVSVQFGIFVGIVSCLVFFRFEYVRPRAAAEMRPGTKRAASVEPKSKLEDERADMVNDRGELEPGESLTEQSAPALPNEYSPEAVEKSRAILAKLYYEQIAPRRKASSIPANSSMAAVAPTYTEVIEEPAVVQTNDPAPQTVAYEQPTQVIVYPPAQFVGFSHPRRFANRCRPAPQPGAFGSNPHRGPDRGGMTHLSAPPAFESPASPSAALGHRQNPGPQSCPSTQKSKPRGTR